MNSESDTVNNPNTAAREAALKYFYQCEVEKIYYFSAHLLSDHLEHFQVDPESKVYIGKLCKGVFDKFEEIDNTISKHSKNWSLHRMGVIDRIVLRMATWELLERKQPKKVVMNEAIELSKVYGTEHSGSFVNGILDAIAQEL